MKNLTFLLLIVMAACAPPQKKKPSFGVIDFSHSTRWGQEYSFKIDSESHCFITFKESEPQQLTYYETDVSQDDLNKFDSIAQIIKNASLDSECINFVILDFTIFRLVYKGASGTRNYYVCCDSIPKPLFLIDKLVYYVMHHAPLVEIDSIVNFESQDGVFKPPPLFEEYNFITIEYAAACSSLVFHYQSPVDPPEFLIPKPFVGVFQPVDFSLASKLIGAYSLKIDSLDQAYLSIKEPDSSAFSNYRITLSKQDLQNVARTIRQVQSSPLDRIYSEPFLYQVNTFQLILKRPMGNRKYFSKRYYVPGSLLTMEKMISSLALFAPRVKLDSVICFDSQVGVFYTDPPARDASY